MATTRKRSCARTPEGSETSSLAEVLRATLEELREIREERTLQQQRQAAFETEQQQRQTALEASFRKEQQQRQAAFEAMLQQRDEELEMLRERLRRTSQQQISPSLNNEIAANSRDRVDLQNIESEVAASASDPRVSFRGILGVKLKPDTFDGNTRLKEFFSQFNLIAHANRWPAETKTAVLVSCLRGKARTVLESIQDIENLQFEELKSRLELRFGETQSLQSYYSQFTNRKQKFGEDLASFGSDIERLSQLAYPECPHSIRDKIACAQFLSALYDGYVKRTLQLEGVTSLRLAIERAKAIKIIQENSFEKKKENNFNLNEKWNKRNYNTKEKFHENNLEGENKEKRNKFQNKFNKFNKNKFEKHKSIDKTNNKNGNQKECWECGKLGHFRSECPGKTENKI